MSCLAHTGGKWTLHRTPAPAVQVGMRLNRSPPNITFRKKKTGGITINSMVQLTRMDERMVQRILQASRGERLAGPGLGDSCGGWRWCLGVCCPSEADALHLKVRALCFLRHSCHPVLHAAHTPCLMCYL